jgi:hypothetical protein
MKIRVCATVEVDPDAYAATYGITREAVRLDVIDAATQVLHDRFTANDEYGTVTP